MKQRTGHLSPIFAALLALKGIAEEETLKKFILELKEKKLTVKTALESIQNNPPPALGVILQRLSDMTGEGFTLVSETLRNKLSNSERNSLAKTLKTSRTQQELWKRLFTETAPAAVNNLNPVAKKPVTKKSKKVAMATN